MASCSEQSRYLFELLQHILPLVGDQVRDHGTTLGCIQYVMLRLVLKRRADDIIAKLQKTQ